MGTRRLRGLSALATAALVTTTLSSLVGASPGTASAGVEAAPQAYTNPVTAGYSIDFPDPSLLRGKDGHWYAFSTGGPYDQSGAGDPYKIARSDDLTHWTKLGSVFTATNRPSWVTSTSGFWAPDVRYLNGRYLLYFTATDTTLNPGGDTAIGVATAPTPAGPWTATDAPLVAPRPGPNGGFLATIDPAEFTDTDGTNYLYYGSYAGGIYATRLSADGMHTVGTPTKVASEERYEGSYVVRHDGHYYFFASTGSCCNGPSTGYTVMVARGDSPLGPFYDRLGHPVLGSRPGGTPVIAPNGNRWIGTGHHALFLDDAGQPWMAYHAIDHDDPYLHISPGFTMRPMLIDRLDWIDGWPTVRGGLGASDTPQPAPVTRGVVDDRFDSAGTTGQNFRTVSGSLEVQGSDGERSDSGGFARLGSDTLALARGRTPSDTRLEADVRSSDSAGKVGSVGLVTRYADPRHLARATLDARARVLRLEAYDGTNRPVLTETAALPADFDAGAWHTLAVQTRGRHVEVDLSDARLQDPWASVSADLPLGLAAGGTVGLAAPGAGGGDVDNVAAAPLYRPSTWSAPEPRLGRLDPAYSDDFDGSTLGAGWQWVGSDPDAKLAGGALTWPTQLGDHTIASSNPPPAVLVRTPPTGDYTIQTRLNVAFGDSEIRNWEQAGLLIFLGDKEFLRYDLVAQGPIRYAEFGKQTTQDGVLSWGNGLIGPPAAAGAPTRLRIVHRVDPRTGEHSFRGGSSTDGRHWVWGVTWTLPAGADYRIGLDSEGTTPETAQQYGKAMATFDYFQVYR